MTETPRFQKLLEPITVGQTRIKNRMVMPPMGTGYGDADGFITERLKAYYAERAKAGIGLVIVEATGVDPAGFVIPRQLRADSDKCVAGLTELAETIRQSGARAAIQIHHAGRAARRAITGVQPVAPSPIAAIGNETPRELTATEIEDIVTRFGEAAARVKKAGFDAVEIHGAHNYLVAQFLSPLTNKREDDYGGDIQGRARFVLEVARAIREAVGSNFTVLCRLNGRELGVTDGITIQDTQQVCRWLQDTGMDAVDISGFGIGHPTMLGAYPMVPGLLVPLAESIKKTVDIPVIAVGRLSPEQAERVLLEGKADMVAFGRALIADPEIPKKIAEGRIEDIRPCTVCMVGRDGLVFREESLRCAVNPATGRERECVLTPAEKRKRVLVIGGGPGGMEAARVAALRGHQVILYEKASELGGQLLVADKPPFKQEVGDLRQYLITQVKKLGVTIKLGQEATPEAVDELGPDAVVVATGSVPTFPSLPGLEQGRVVAATDVLAGKAEVGAKVVVIGGELVGCETADLLSEQGKRVTVTRRGAAMATNVSPTVRMALLGRLCDKGVQLLCEVKYEKVSEQGLHIVDKQGQRRLIEADTIVLATGSRPNADLAKSLKGKVSEVHVVGDAVQPRGIAEAIGEANAVARQL